MAGWKRLAKATADGTSSTLSVSFTAQEVLKLQIYAENTSGAGNFQIRFNNDTTANRHKTRRVYDGAGTGSDRYDDTSSDKFISYSATSALQSFMVIDVFNMDNEEHLVMGNCVESGATGAGATGVPHTVNWMGKYTEKQPQVTSVQLITNSNNLNDKSYIIVLTTADDIVTDEKTTITNVPANTRYEETDTRKIYRRVLGNASIPDLSSSTGWTEVDAGSCTFDLDTSNEKIDFSSGMNSSFSGISYDLQTILGSGTNANDTKWTLRFKLTPTSTPPNDSSIALMLSSGQNETTGTSADRVGFYLYTGSTYNMTDFGGYSTGGTQFYTDGSGWGASLYSNDTSISKGTDPLYIEIKRTSTTSATMSITTNSDYTTGAYTKTTTGSTTLPSTVQNLRYLTFQNAQNATNSNRFAGKIEDIKFYNDTTTPSDTRWVERNTA